MGKLAIGEILRGLLSSFEFRVIRESLGAVLELKNNCYP